ncbi:phage major tail tube protein [uncultured Sphingomonas sp.]|uniref:phage major tail tube protein n=1 Tax=uncultured Sphingomonas sp. TaxID=158754 RepID=UPI0025E1DA3A|nr:phage major tail tube protein [uncultured Sphingomonas sp.]
MSALPPKLKNFNATLNGTSYLGVVSEITLPKIAEKVEQHRGGGMMGEVDIGLGLEKLEMELKFGGMVAELLAEVGRPGVGATLIRFNGAYQEDVAGGVKAAELIARAKIPEVDPGSAKTGDNTEWTVKATLSYLKWSVSGRRIVEIDVLNSIWITNGFDNYAAIRAAMLI